MILPPECVRPRSSCHGGRRSRLFAAQAAGQWKPLFNGKDLDRVDGGGRARWPGRAGAAAPQPAQWKVEEACSSAARARAAAAW